MCGMYVHVVRQCECVHVVRLCDVCGTYVHVVR